MDNGSARQALRALPRRGETWGDYSATMDAAVAGRQSAQMKAG